MPFISQIGTGCSSLFYVPRIDTSRDVEVRLERLNGGMDPRFAHWNAAKFGRQLKLRLGVDNDHALKIEMTNSLRFRQTDQVEPVLD